MVEKTSEVTKNAINRKSAYALPNRPSDSGMKPDEIRRAFWRPVTDTEDSVLSELDRVVDEANAEFDAREKKVMGAVPRLEELNSEANRNIEELKKYDELVPQIEELAEEARASAMAAEAEANRAENSLDGKLDKVTTRDNNGRPCRIYGIDGEGKQVMYSGLTAPVTGGVAVYAVGGCLRTNTPITNLDCANKAYVLQEAEKAYDAGYIDGYNDASSELESTIADLESRLAELGG